MPRIVMRRTTRANVRRPTAITAASTRLAAPASATTNDPSNGFGVSLPRPAEWSEKAWDYLNRVGELSYYVGWRSNAVSRAQLVAASVDPLTGKPTAIDEDDPRARQVAAIVRDIGGDAQAMLLKRLAVFLTVPGDGYVAMIEHPTTGRECWYALSREEISTSGGQKIILTLPDKTKHEFNRENDLLFRVWEPDPRRAWDTTSAVRANLDVLQEIVRSTQTIDNASTSRLIGKGVLFVPDEMNLPSTPAPTAAPASGPDPAVAPVWQQGGAQDLQDLLFEVGTTAYKDQNSMAALMPIVAAVPGEYADKIKHLTFGTDVPDTALKTRDAAIRRLALGLDVSPERLLGMSTGNHWSAWAIGEDDVRLHLVPVLETIVDAFTEHVLRPALVAVGIDPALYAVWFDVSGLTQDPDRKAEAIAAHQRGAITTAALRRYLGFNDEDGYELDTMDGWIELARDKVATDITQLGALAAIAAPAGAELDVAATPSTPAALPTAEDSGADSEPSTAPIRVPTTGPPVETATAVRVIVDMCVRRALELSGRRMLTRGNRYSVPQHVPAHEVYRHLIAPAPGEVAKLMAGWESIVSGDMLNHTGISPTSLRRVVEARTMAELLGPRS